MDTSIPATYPSNSLIPRCLGQKAVILFRRLKIAGDPPTEITIWTKNEKSRPFAERSLHELRFRRSQPSTLSLNPQNQSLDEPVQSRVYRVRHVDVSTPAKTAPIIAASAQFHNFARGHMAAFDSVTPLAYVFCRRRNQAVPQRDGPICPIERIARRTTPDGGDRYEQA